MNRPALSPVLQSAVNLIATIDGAAAKAFAEKPFNRHGLITALHSSMSNSSTYAHLADEVAMKLRSVVDATQQDVELPEDPSQGGEACLNEVPRPRG